MATQVHDQTEDLAASLVTVRRSRIRSGWRPVVGVWSVALLLSLWAGWPGWMSPDTVDMWSQAAGRSPITDWHTPLLTFVWQFLRPAEFGPIGPFVLQTLTFWSGVLLVGLWLLSSGYRRAWLLFVLIPFVPAAWLTSWVWKDSAIVALIPLSFGLALSSQWARGRTTSSLALLAASCGTLGLAAGMRWYLAPALLLGALALLVASSLAPRRETLKRIMPIGFGAFLAVCLGVVALQAVVIRPAASHADGAVMLLDLSRVECATTTAQQRAVGLTFLPDGSVEGPPGADLCETFLPYNAEGILWPDDPATSVRVRVPENDAESQRLRQAWIDVIFEKPTILAEARLNQVDRLLTGGEESYTPGSVWTPAPLTVWGSIGSGVEQGWPSRGGIVLALTAQPISLMPAGIPFVPIEMMGLWWVIVLPAILFVTSRRGRANRSHRVILLLLFPAFWVANFAVFAPANGLRYIGPAVMWSFLSLVVVLTQVREDQVARLDEARAEVVKS